MAELTGPSSSEEAEMPVRARGGIPALYIFARLGSLYGEQQHYVHEVPQPLELAIMLTVCGNPFKVTVGDDSRTVRAALINHRFPRAIDARGTDHVTFRVSPLHRSFTRLAYGQLHELDREAFSPFQDCLEAAVRGELSYAEAQRLLLDVVAQVAEKAPPAQELDHRVPLVLSLVQNNPVQSLESLAQAVELSPSRLSHLFSTSFGMSLRSFLIWRRIRRAVLLLVRERKMSMTEIAYQLGFSDSSHFTRTFYQFTGFTPSQLRRSHELRVIID